MSDAWLSGMKKWRIPRPKMTSTGSQRSASTSTAVVEPSSTRRPADPPRDYLCDTTEQQLSAETAPSDTTDTCDAPKLS